MERLRSIEQEAGAVLDGAESEAEQLGLSTPTFDRLVALAAGLAESVPNLTHDGVRLAGQLDCSARLPKLRYEAYDPPPRQRFSIAHELGHFILHETRRYAGLRSCDQRGVDPEEDTGTSGMDEEAEANAFAAAFLVPATRLEAAVVTFGVGTGFLAERFGVSLQAMHRRWEILRVLDG